MFLVSSCGLLGGGGQEKPEAKPEPGATAPAEGQPIRSHAMAWPGQARVDLMSLYRVQEKTVVRFQVVNEGSESLDLYGTFHQFTSQEDAETTNKMATGITATKLLDAVNGQLYYTLFDDTGKCLCTRHGSVLSIGAGETYDMVAAFPAVPESVETLTVMVPNTPPFADVPIAAEGKSNVPLEPNSAEMDIASAATEEPVVEPIITTVEDENKAEDDDGKKLDVRLSADVLFALNKANLRPKAKQVLNEVAAKIDESPSNTIKIDGHTDSSGNDAINVPLSKRRAESVKKALEKAVTRSGVSYETAGHGSSDPIADNKTERGRKQNRRVTVSFDKPKPAEPTSSPAPPASGQASTEDPSKLPVSQTVTPSGDNPGTVPVWPKEMKIEIHDPVRGANGYTTLAWTIHNESQEAFQIGGAYSDAYAFLHGNGPNTITVGSGGKRYLVLKDATWRCVCSTLPPITPVYAVDPGESATLWGVYQIPGDVSSVTVDIPGFHQAQNVPIK